MKSIQEIQTDHGNGEYSNTTLYPKMLIHPQNGVIDENKSVKWNREEIERLKTEHTEACKAWRKENFEKEIVLRQDVQAYIAATFEFNTQQANLIECLVWDNYHSSLSDYFGYINEYAERIKAILNA